jgi:hypothetical protein
MWDRKIEDYLEEIIKNCWWVIVERKTFLLISPGHNNSAILNTCNDSSRGLRKAARILLAAKNAVSINIPNELIDLLKKHAAESEYP